MGLGICIFINFCSFHVGFLVSKGIVLSLFESKAFNTALAKRSSFLGFSHSTEKAVAIFTVKDVELVCLAPKTLLTILEQVDFSRQALDRFMMRETLQDGMVNIDLRIPVPWVVSGKGIDGYKECIVSTSLSNEKSDELHLVVAVDGGEIVLNDSIPFSELMASLEKVCQLTLEAEHGEAANIPLDDSMESNSTYH